ncbi:MAG: hypothetical protein RL369_1211, partial [Pseudomonadota bacterium]
MSARSVGAEQARTLMAARPSSLQLSVPSCRLIKQFVLLAFVAAFLSLVATSPAIAALLTRDDIDKLLDGQFIVGEVQPDMPVYPLF